MDIRGKNIDYDTVVSSIINSVSDNIVIHPDAKPIGDNRYGFRGRIIARDSKGQQARRSASGRHGPYACWHAYRDALRAVFKVYPHAVVTTSLARYNGSDGFESVYPETANKNVGSMVNPAFMSELCDCVDYE